MNDFFDAGSQVNVNFAPAIYYEGWLEDYKLLFDELNNELNEQVKQQFVTERTPIAVVSCTTFVRPSLDQARFDLRMVEPDPNMAGS